MTSLEATQFELARHVQAHAEVLESLGTGIIKALSQQLEAQVSTVSGPEGTVVSITHATFTPKVAEAS